MSTLEKAIGILQEMPENKLEAVYMYIRFVDSQPDTNETILPPNKSPNSLIGTAHEYATPDASENVTKRKRGFQGIMSFAGTLPEDFDYKKELEEARDEKYARFV